MMLHADDSVALESLMRIEALLKMAIGPFLGERSILQSTLYAEELAGRVLAIALPHGEILWQGSGRSSPERLYARSLIDLPQDRADDALLPRLSLRSVAALKGWRFIVARGTERESVRCSWQAREERV